MKIYTFYVICSRVHIHFHGEYAEDVEIQAKDLEQALLRLTEWEFEKDRPISYWQLKAVREK